MLTPFWGHLCDITSNSFLMFPIPVNTFFEFPPSDLLRVKYFFGSIFIWKILGMSLLGYYSLSLSLSLSLSHSDSFWMLSLISSYFFLYSLSLSLSLWFILDVVTDKHLFLPLISLSLSLWFILDVVTDKHLFLPLISLSLFLSLSLSLSLVTIMPIVIGVFLGDSIQTSFKWSEV